jgi:hypothetical protein
MSSARPPEGTVGQVIWTERLARCWMETEPMGTAPSTDTSNRATVLFGWISTPHAWPRKSACRTPVSSSELAHTPVENRLVRVLHDWTRPSWSSFTPVAVTNLPARAMRSKSRRWVASEAMLVPLPRTW